MPKTIQEFFAAATEKAAADLTEAFLRLPEDKRNWKPAEKSRSALDQMAECTLLNLLTADLIETRQWSDSSFHSYAEEKAALEQDWETCHTALQANTQKIMATLRTVPDDALDVEIVMPWQTQTLAQIVAYPYWNMTYHAGQINYIASMLGCLD